MTDWPGWATEKVEVRPPDLYWQERGEKERLLLEATIGAWLVAPIEHVGSTAVPKLSAKPILDFQAAVTNLDCAADIAAALSPAGWHYVPPELDARAWRRFLVQVAQGRRVAHLHVDRTGATASICSRLDSPTSRRGLPRSPEQHLLAPTGPRSGVTAEPQRTRS